MLKWLKSLPVGRRRVDAPTPLAEAAMRVCRFEFDAAEELCRQVLASGNHATADETARALELLRAIEHNRTSSIYAQVYKPQAQQELGPVASPAGIPSSPGRRLAAAARLWLYKLSHRGWAASAAEGTFEVGFEDNKRMIIVGMVPEKCQVVYAFANELLFGSARTLPQRPDRLGRSKRFTFRIAGASPARDGDDAVRITLSTGRGIVLHQEAAPFYAGSWASGAAAVEDKIRSGAVLTKHGSIKPAPSDGLVDRWLGTYEAVSGFMAAKWKKPVFLYYGSLLGAVRDQAVIPFDDDFDVGYFSEKTTVAEVREEMIEIVASLVASDRNIHVRLLTFFFKVNIDGGPVDVFPTWHDGEHLWSPVMTRLRCEPNLLTDLKEIEFLGRRVQIPARAETFLELKYGPHWRKPDPAYRMQPQAGVEFPFRALAFGDGDRRRILARAREIAGSPRVGKVRLQNE